MSRSLALATGLLLAMLPPACTAVVDIRTFGAIPGSSDAAANNTLAFTRALASVPSGVTLLVPPGVGVFHTLGGIEVTGRTNLTLQLEGTLTADPDFLRWAPDGSSFRPILKFRNCTGLTITGTGTIDGQGKTWWDRYVFGPCGFDPTKKHNSSNCLRRPKALIVEECTDVLIEGITSLNSPSFNVQLSSVLRAEVRYVTVETDRAHVRALKAIMRSQRLAAAAVAGDVAFDDVDGGLRGLEPEDLNTDGIDPSGRDIWIHHVNISNDDDSIAVKPTDATGFAGPCTQNILIEDSVMTGFGASIGSVPPHAEHNCVRNVTFRNISMPKTGKGIYIKSNPSCGPGQTAEITHVLYEDITITKPEWWAIWIGPQQQQEPGSALGAKCALTYPFPDSCPTQGCVDFRDITLRNVVITEPWLSPGVILGNSTNPMQNVTFDNVVATMQSAASGDFPFRRKYRSENAQGRATGGTTPDPGLLQ